MHTAGAGLGMEEGIHLAPGCCMEMEEAMAPLELHIRRLERTCPWGCLAGAACRDYMAPQNWHKGILCLHRSDSEQGQATDAPASPNNPPAQDMTPHVSPCKMQRLPCKLLAATVAACVLLRCFCGNTQSSETSETGLTMATGSKTPSTPVAAMLPGTEMSPETSPS